MTELDALPSLMQIKASIPNEYFQANVLTSLRFAAQDVTLSAALVLCMRHLYFHYTQLFTVAYIFYAALLGAIGMGLFVLGHDAGHGSFSRYPKLNYIVGVILHSLILTPYTAWQLSHRSHHKNTGHIDNDEVFKPIRKRHFNPALFAHQNLSDVAFGLGLAWWAYLWLGFAPERRFFYHYNVSGGELFKGHRAEAAGSLLAMAAVLGALWQWALVDGFAAVALLYVVPLNVFAFFLVLITFLHHNDEGNVAWYSGAKWSYVRGNLSSVDRSYGPALDYILHDIGTHQVHHLFPKVPHYHLRQATAHFRREFPELVHTATEPVMDAFWRNVWNYRDKHVIADDADHVRI